MYCFSFFDLSRNMFENSQYKIIRLVNYKHIKACKCIEYAGDR
jgi:hypothetical protein